MPYSNPYSTSYMGIGEARLSKMVSILEGTLTDLNSSLSRSPATGISFSADTVLLGDPTNITVPVICVVGGGKQNSIDREIQDIFTGRNDTKGFLHTVYTHIGVYLPTDYSGSNAYTSGVTHVANLETARQRICDHIIKRVFNSAQYAEIEIDSYEYDSTYTYKDLMQDCRITTVQMGLADKGLGSSIVCYAAYLTHRAQVGGSNV